jgi:hypothetical protein
MFMLIVLFLPKGIVGIAGQARAWFEASRERKSHRLGGAEESPAARGVSSAEPEASSVPEEPLAKP